MISQLLSAKVAAIAATAVLGAGAAAAATGSLPASAQSAASDALSHVGISVPNPDSHAGTNLTNRGQSGTHTPNAHAQYGLCTALAAGPNSKANSQAGSSSQSQKDSAPPFTGLSSTKCAKVTQPGQSGAGQSNKASTTGNASTAGSSQGVVTTPNSGGTNTANSASSGANSTGTKTARTDSGGASSAGAGNATSHKP